MTRPSLTQMFEAPDEYVGAFGWLCGYSADAPFFNEAAERFTRATFGRRAQEGRIALALMCDPGQRALSMLDVPGLAHLPVRQADNLPFSLLHAKVALLGFRRQTSEPGWRLRLIVSTGNWTVETLEDSLDLAWCVDVGSDEMRKPDKSLLQRCADITAAAQMLQWLRALCDDRLLDAPIHGQPGPSAIALANMAAWLKACSGAKGGAQPRFVDNRKSGLLQQLPGMIAVQACAVRRNRLVMGSGFYEGLESHVGKNLPSRVPSVLERIVERLQNESLLTQRAQVSLVVNEEGCQAVAGAMPAIADRGWAVYPPGRPVELFGKESRRTLHAKFILSWNQQADSLRCASAWLYLGSGNLTKPGFLQKAARRQGNLEAGVVFDPGELVLEKTGKASGAPAVTSLLPVQFEHTLDTDSAPSPGPEMPARPPAYESAPVAWLQWLQDGAQGSLTALGSDHEPITVIGPDGQACPRDGERWLWQGGCPRQVCIRWGAPQREALVPVQDPFGRMAPLPLPGLQLDEVGRLLDAFPAINLPDDDDDALTGDPPADADAPTGGGRPATAGGDTYTVRAMVMQLESIATKQTAIHETDWTTWCLRLEQILTQASDSADVAAFRALQLNPLGPLRAGPFRPDFALDASTEPGRCYEAALDRIARAWQVQNLAPLGGQP